MKIMWFSNAPWLNTGYGRQTRYIIHRLKQAGHEIACLAYTGLENGSLYHEGILCLPRKHYLYGQDSIAEHCTNWGADVLISLTDVWAMNPETFKDHVKWIPWYPVDHDPLPATIKQKLSYATKRIAMSEYGRDKTNEAGIDCSFIPHGIDTSIYRPRNKKEARDKLGLPNDSFIVGTVAMNKGNPSRKNLVELLTAFRDFNRLHKDSIYVLHTNLTGPAEDSINIPELVNFLGLEMGKNVYACNQYYNSVGIPDDYMADFYSALDVHLLVSMGEGFGIPIIEAQACDCPVIVGDWTAMGELCYAGRKIDKDDAQAWYTPLGSYQYKPNVGAVTEALCSEYEEPTFSDGIHEKIHDVYDINKISASFVDLLSQG